MSWTFAEAEEKLRNASKASAEAEKTLLLAGEKLAKAEQKYLYELHLVGVKLRSENVAATAWEKIAKGQKEIVDLAFERDMAEHELSVAKAQVFRRQRDRHDANRLAEWAMRQQQLDGSIYEDRRISWQVDDH